MHRGCTSVSLVGTAEEEKDTDVHIPGTRCAITSHATLPPGFFPLPARTVAPPQLPPKHPTSGKYVLRDGILCKTGCNASLTAQEVPIHTAPGSMGELYLWFVRLTAFPMQGGSFS